MLEYRSIVRRERVLGATVLLFHLCSVFCEEKSSLSATPAPETTLECRWTDIPLAIDGIAEDIWQTAPVIQFSAQARRNIPSRVRLLWDREYLYFLAEIADSDVFVKAVGDVWRDDALGIFLKPAPDKPGYYQFAVNAANVVSPAFFPRRDMARDKPLPPRAFDIQTHVKMLGTLNKAASGGAGWVAEGRVAWTNFTPTHGRPAEGETWAFALCRSDVDNEVGIAELSSCAQLEHDHKMDFHRYEDYLNLRFLGPTGKRSVPIGLQKRVPWNGQIKGTPETPAPFVVQRRYPRLALPNPIYVAHEPGTKNLFILHQPKTWPGATRLLRVRDNADVDAAETLLDHNRIAYGLAFHPNYAKNGFVYLGSNGPLSGGEKRCRISRFTVARQAPFLIDPKSELVILEWVSDGHNGCDLTFGLDGMLYFTSGDGTNDSDVWQSGQDLSRLLAKVLRVDVDHPDAGRNYSVPRDNPFVGQPNVCPETWAYGLRNPWRITHDPETGQIWVGQNGQDMWEQVYLIQKGQNYGWSLYEGSHSFYPNRKAGPQPVTFPIVEHAHSEARSLTGGQVYYGQKSPELRGMYIYGDWSTGKIWGLKHDGNQIQKHIELADTHLHITGFGFDSAGELLICDYLGGGCYGLEHVSPEDTKSVFPRKLSETGLFASLKKHDPNPGVIPYSVNAPQYVDGAQALHFLALPAGDAKINYSNERGWEFPDGTVVAQSLGLDMDAGRPESLRWVETRVLVKRTGNWTGFTYMWNEDQSDAEIAPKSGEEKLLAVKDAAEPGGVRTQKWRIPSRAECLVCHSRAANFVLGLNELQMNREQDYGGVRANQLLTLESLGVLRMRHKDRVWHDMSRNLKREGKSDEESSKILEKIFDTKGQREAPYTSLLPRAPEKLNRLVDPCDSRESLDARARSYLHANCAHCHVMAGGGNAAMELEFTTPADQMKVFGIPPLHTNFGLDNPHLVAPANPQNSILFHRLSIRGSGQMPPLAANRVDREGLQLIQNWIASMQPGYGTRSAKLPPVAELEKCAGDANKGQLVFEKNCGVCHRVGHRGTDFGPDLTQIGARLPRAKIIESILDPNAVIDPKFQNTMIKTRSGELLNGIVAENTETGISIREPGGKTRTLPMSDIAKQSVSKTSAMPSGLENAMSQQELIDMIEYLAGLK